MTDRPRASNILPPGVHAAGRCFQCGNWIWSWTRQGVVSGCPGSLPALRPQGLVNGDEMELLPKRLLSAMNKPEEVMHDLWQGEGEPCPQAGPAALGPDAAAVGLHDAPTDGQPQTGPKAALLLTLPAGEPAEQAGQALRRNSHPVVGHGKGPVDAVPRRAQPDGRGLGGMASGVGEQVEQHLHDAPPVGRHRGQVRRHTHGKRHSSCWCEFGGDDYTVVNSYDQEAREINS